jgi:hypothetical protein
MIINQFQTDPALISISDRHHAWHTAGGAHGFPSRQFAQGTPGSGREFFQFHRDLMNEFFAWNNVHQVAPANSIAAWSNIPPELKVPETGWPNPWPGLDLAASEARIKTNTPAFINDDALGIFVETMIHNWIHGAVAAAPAFGLPAAEQSIISGFHSIQSTWFYKIHGLVDLWWSRFLHPKSVVKDVVDTGVKAHFKEVIDVKTHFKEILDVPKPHKEFKEKDLIEGDVGKRFADAPDPMGPLVDPEIIANLSARVKQLEARLTIKKSPFIQPFQRPNVGESVTKAPGAENEQKK